MLIPQAIVQTSGGGLTLISDTTLAVDTANFDISGISGSYRALMLLSTLRSSRAADSDSVRIRFNNDSGNNYDYQYSWGVADAGAAFQTDHVFAQPGLDILTITAATATAGAAQHSQSWIPHYADTTFHKQILTRGGAPLLTGGDSYFDEASAGRWRDTSAITRIQYICNNGNFVAGSRLTIYAV